MKNKCFQLLFITFCITLVLLANINFKTLLVKDNKIAVLSDDSLITTDDTISDQKIFNKNNYNVNNYNVNEQILINIILNKMQSYRENNYENIGDKVFPYEDNTYYFEYYDCNEREISNVVNYFGNIYYHFTSSENVFCNFWHEQSNKTNCYVVTICPTQLKIYDNEYDKCILQINDIAKTLKCNTEQETVMNIAQYVADNITYTYCSGTIENALIGKTKCDGYSFLFKYLCESLNISCDYISGVTNDGNKHAWNRVYFADGTVRYYDTTWYDSSNYDTKYLNSESSINTITSINWRNLK